MSEERTDEELRVARALEPLKQLIESSPGRHIGAGRQFETKNGKIETEVHLIMSGIDLESIKQKITDTASTVVGKTTDFARDVAEKGQVAAKKTKLNVEIAGERGTLKEKYQELGKLYYEKYAGSMDPDFEAAAAAVAQSLEKIAAKQAEIDALSAEPEEEPAAEPTEAVEPDHIVDEIEQTVEAEADQAAAIAEEVSQEAQKLYEESVGTVANEQN